MRRRPRYTSSTDGWYRGNTHIHTTASDGGLSVPELSRLYGKAGYDFLVQTDHWVASAHDGKTVEGMLWLDGVELDGRDRHGVYYHVVCLGRQQAVSRDMGFATAVDAAAQQGAMLVLAHPHWTGNSHAHALALPFHGVEVYNHVCWWLNGKSGGTAHYDHLLCTNPNALAFAVDDAHLRPQEPAWNGGWIAVQAPERSREALTAAIRSGSFYGTTGPQLYDIRYEADTVEISCSPVRSIRCVGPKGAGLRTLASDDAELTSARFQVPDEWPSPRIELEDSCGRRAWTNPLYTSDRAAAS